MNKTMFYYILPGLLFGFHQEDNCSVIAGQHPGTFCGRQGERYQRQLTLAINEPIAF